MNERRNFHGLSLDYLLPTVYQEVPVLLSLMDERENSETFGCFYPPFWREKREDFVNVRAQEAVLTLALLYSQDYRNNPYYGDKRLLEHAIAGMAYWTRLQHRDGSFDEWRRLEHGQAGTAFSVFAMTSAYKLIKGFLEEDLKRQLFLCFRKSANFLCRNPDLAYINHEAVAVSALYSCYKLVRDRSYLERITEKTRLIAHNQSDDGWFREGNGPDSGYNTVTLSYLAFYYDKSKDKSVLPILKRAIEFSSYFLYPDGLTGGGFNSRCAGMLFPLGFILLSDKVRMARLLAIKSLRSLTNGKMNGLYTLNNMRKCITLYLLLWSYSEAKNRLFGRFRQKLPTQGEDHFVKHMKHARVLLVKTPLYYMVIGTRKGCLGAIHSYRANTTVLMSSPLGLSSISGIYGKTSDGFIVSSNWAICVEEEEAPRKKRVSTTLHLPLVSKRWEMSRLRDRIIDRPPLISLYHLASELGLRHHFFAIYDKFKSHLMKRPFDRPALCLDRQIRWQDGMIDVRNEVTFLRHQDYEGLYVGETFILPRNGHCEVRRDADGVSYLVKGRKVMTMKADRGEEIDLRLGKRSDLEFNNVQPVLSLMPLNTDFRRVNIDYSLYFCPL